MHWSSPKEQEKDGRAGGQYTLEFKLEAVRMVTGGPSAPVSSKILGVPVPTLGNWVRLGDQGQPKGAGDKALSPEHSAQMRLAFEQLRRGGLRVARQGLCGQTAGEHGREQQHKGPRPWPARGGSQPDSMWDAYASVAG